MPSGGLRDSGHFPGHPSLTITPQIARGVGIRSRSLPACGLSYPRAACFGGGGCAPGDVRERPRLLLRPQFLPYFLDGVPAVVKLQAALLTRLLGDRDQLELATNLGAACDADFGSRNRLDPLGRDHRAAAGARAGYDNHSRLRGGGNERPSTY